MKRKMISTDKASRYILDAEVCVQLLIKRSLLVFFLIHIVFMHHGAVTVATNTQYNFAKTGADLEKFMSRIRKEELGQEENKITRPRHSKIRVEGGNDDFKNQDISHHENAAHGFSDHEITIPIRLHGETGMPLLHGHHFRSRTTPDFLFDDSGESKHRTRRDAGEIANENNSTSQSNDFSFANYTISAFGKEFRLSLTPYTKFIAPTFTLQYTGNVTHDIDANFEQVPTHCFYAGFVNSRPDHKAVLSICSGLFGAFRTDTMDYLIQPHEQDEKTNTEPHHEIATKRHRIYRRSIENSKTNSKNLCAYQESSPGHSKMLKESMKETKEFKTDYQQANTKAEQFLNGRPKCVFDPEMLQRLKTSRLATKNLINQLRLERKLHKRSDSSTTTYGTDEFARIRKLRKLKRNRIHLYRNNCRRPLRLIGPHTVLSEEAKSRKKRYLSYPRNVEVMVTADNQMYRAHSSNLQHYVLTLMAIVHHVYLDPSIENLINIVLVKLVVIGDGDVEYGPAITKNAHDCLRNFCLWQSDQNDPDDSHPNHHDTAVLITRQDICRSETACDTLGLAELGTMCDPLRSCSINEDNGLSTAFTIAHEIGHEFNAPHDNNEKCISPQGKPEKMHVMSPTLDHKSQPWSWSSCSAKYITDFLDYGNGQCLLDAPPQRVLPLPAEEPGQIYDVNQQCSFVYGDGVTHCGFMTTCVRLWCVSADRRHGCRTPHMPWADGTKCDVGKWCYRGQCVPEDRHRRPVDGQWGEWSRFGDCSRTCGGGVRIAERECNNPKPQDGGKYCVGKRKKFRSCNWQECRVQRDFRAEQCSSYSWSRHNRRQIHGVPATARWIPKYDGILLQDRCKLICQVKRSDQYAAPWYVLSPKVINGTPCGPETNDICVEGICKRAGCDHVLNSNTREDECGICGGDNSYCRTVKGIYDVGNRYGYSVVVQIPVGATNTLIEQRSYNMLAEDNNYLALKDSSGVFILNGNRNVVQFEHIIQKRSKNGIGYDYYFDYSGTDNIVERINSTYPLRENITVMVLSAGDLVPPDIRYRFNIPLPDYVTYTWDPYGPWSICSRSCQGRTKRKLLCVRSTDNQTVADQKCYNKEKPPSIIRTCNTHCVIKWQLASSECSSRCGIGTATLNYECIKLTTSRIGVDSTVEHIPDSECTTDKPSTRATCHGECLPASWHYEEWSDCTRTCGGGSQRRSAVCRDSKNALLPDNECDVRDRIKSRTCSNYPCPQWVTSVLSRCLATCGDGVRRRRVWCRGPHGNVRIDSKCDLSSKPPATVPCPLDPCPTWQYGPWQECSVTCGIGFTMRRSQCINNIGQQVDAEKCQEGLREKDTKTCTMSVSCPDIPSPRFDRPMLINRGIAGRGVRIPEDESPPAVEMPFFDEDNRIHKVIKNPIIPDMNQISSKMIQDMPQPEVVDTHLRDISIYVTWRTGHWTDCSTTCGPGIHERYVSCRHDDGHEVSDSYCGSAETRPAHKEVCENQPCLGKWRTGEWSECSVSCGEGVKTRYVNCMYNDKYDVESRCQGIAKPETEAHCMQMCARNHQEDDSHHKEPANGPKNSGIEYSDSWQTGPWSQCSSSCGSGNQKRVVVCHGNCDPSTKPPVLGLCDAGACPTWRHGSWSLCSKSCGGGIKYRQVRCVMVDGNLTHDARCNIMNRPSPSNPCNRAMCPGRRYRWKTTHWSECSVTCGRGTKRRNATCVDRRKNPVQENLCADMRGRRPRIVRKCRTKTRCPRWHTGEWNQCSVNCGVGVRIRGVRCRYKRKTIADSLCDEKDKPEDVENCNGTKCNENYRWVTSTWQQCSRSCGSGLTTREVNCVNGENIHVADYLCLKISTKPLSRQYCSLGPCGSYWNNGIWSECSTTCGQGMQTREVQCVFVDRQTLTWRPATNCDTRKKPYNTRDCSLNNCNSEFYWRVGSWSKCSASCGEGVSVRLVICFSRYGQNEVADSACEVNSSKPESQRRCNISPCVPATCRHVQVQFGDVVDAEYNLLVRGKRLKIYCNDMNTMHPKEYISLQGENENYSEIYGQRLINPDTCPNNGSRSESCDCKSYPGQGKTFYRKIRLDVGSMKVITSDSRFSVNERGQPVEFGVAGDCYSRASCPQGEFRINLAGTGLAITTTTQWSSYGRNAVQQINRLNNGIIVEGKCGGYCGQCRPDPLAGLIVTHLQTR